MALITMDTEVCARMQGMEVGSIAIVCSSFANNAAHYACALNVICKRFVVLMPIYSTCVYAMLALGVMWPQCGHTPIF